MSPFDQTIEHMALELQQAEDTSILFGVTDDTVLRDHALDVLRKRMPAEITLRDFRYDAEHLSLLEGAVEATASGDGRPAVSVTGLEALPRDKRTEAIQLLNLQRNRFGRTSIAVILWVNRAILAEISTQAPDFYSWRSVTLFVEPPPGWDSLESMRRSYLQALVAHCEYVNLQGLAPMRGGQIVQMRMDDIFIPLRAEQQVKSADSPAFLSLRGSASAEPRMIEEIDEVQQPANILNQMRRTRAQWAFEATQEVTARPVDIPELLQENRAVVLGDPGAGKTTLLRYVAYGLVKSQLANGQSEILNRVPNLAGCLPVYVRIGEYAQHLQQKPESTLDAFASLGCQVRQLPLSDDLVKDAMGQGRILFLLDGMDEIIDTIQRREVAQRIEEFAFSHPRCRMLVTSRVVGYREAQLSREFSQFTISPFEKDEIHRFIQSWYKALGMPEGADKLVQAIEGSSSIRRLASNPLLLTVIALIHWKGDKLPRHRARLYRIASETLVDEWMSHRRVTPEGWDVQETMQVLLPAIAWHLHQTSSTGLIDEQELDRLLVEMLLRHDPTLSENEAHTRASQFRRNVSEFSGIFLERGLDQNDCGSYGFLHRTFEEYFAALRLADIWERAGNSVFKPLLDDPRWTEAILLTAGHFGEFSQYQATCFVRMILEAHSEHEDILHRDLLLAAQCLADDVRLDADLRRAILSQLIKIYFASNSPRTLREDIRKVFARLSSTLAGVSLLKVLTQRLTIPKSEVCRLTAVAALGKMGQAAATPEVLAALLRLLSDPVRAVRRAAVAALGQMSQAAATPEVFAALLRLLLDPAGTIRRAAAAALGQMGQAAATPEVVAALLRLLSDPEEAIRRAAAAALGQMGQAAATPEVVAALLRLLSDPAGTVRWAAVAAWLQMGQAAATPEVSAALLKLLSDPARAVRRAAARTLAQMGQAAATPEVLSASIGFLFDPREGVRQAAAIVLGRMGRAAIIPEILPTLLKILTNPEWYVRQAAVAALGQMGQAAATPEVVAALLKLLSDPSGAVRSEAARVLGQMGQAAATPEVFAALLKLLSDPTGAIRRVAAMALEQMGQAAATPEVLAALLKLLSDPEEAVRRAAVAALGQMGQAAATPEVLAALLRLVSDPTGAIRGVAAAALEQMGPVVASLEALSALYKLLTDHDRNVHEVAEWALRKMSLYIGSQDRSEAIKLFLALARSNNIAQRDIGYVGLRNLLAARHS